MSIFSDAIRTSLPPNPSSMEEGSVTSAISSGVSFGSDPAKLLKTTVNNVLGVNSTTASTLGPNFDRFSVLTSPQSFGVVGNLFESGQDLVPIARIASNFGGTFIGNELTQINVANLLQNPGTELSTFAKKLSDNLSNQAKQQLNSVARSVVQDVKDVFRGAVNTLLDPAAAKTTNLGVTDSRLSYAFFGPLDASRNYSKGIGSEKPTVKRPIGTSLPSGEAGPPGPPPPPAVGFQGVEPIVNPHYVFRLNMVANGMSAGDDGAAQSRLLLDKESRMGVSSVGKKEVTLSALLSKFGNFSQKNPTPYRAADFLWLKYYNIIPLTRLVTLRRYMFPIQDNLTRSPYLGGGTNKGGAWRIKGWSNNPMSQMVTYFGGESGNDLSTILKISVASSWEQTGDSKVNDIKQFSGFPVDVRELFSSSRFAKVSATLAKNLAKIPFSGVSAGRMLGGPGVSTFIDTFTKEAKGQGVGATELAAGILAYVNVIDKTRFAGIASYLDLFNPYEQGGYLSDLYREPYNRVLSTYKRKPGLTGGVMGEISLKFEYSLKSIGQINAKAAMLDIMANILATTHYRGTFWGGEARFYLNKGLFPLLDEEQTISFVKMIWSGNFNGAVQKMEEMIKGAFGGKFSTADIIHGLLATADANTVTPKNAPSTGTTIAGGGADIAATSASNANSVSGLIPDKLKDLAAIDLLAGLFGMTGGDGNASIPSFQALKTGAPVGEWHLTVGNPFKPIAVIGNLICDGVDISFNNELGPDDFPTEMTATVKLKPGMPRANQDVESVFNDGFGPLYIPKPDLFEGGKSLEQVQEEISKQVARSGIFDFMDLLPESTVESLSNFHKITSNTSEILPSPHMARTPPEKNK